jgi:hypothetical protein
MLTTLLLNFVLHCFLRAETREGPTLKQPFSHIRNSPAQFLKVRFKVFVMTSGMIEGEFIDAFF